MVSYIYNYVNHVQKNLEYGQIPNLWCLCVCVKFVQNDKQSHSRSGESEETTQWTLHTVYKQESPFKWRFDLYVSQINVEKMTIFV